VKGADNIVAALGHPDRVRRIELLGTRKSDLNRFAAAMTDPFPALTHLELRPATKKVSVLPDSFLGGSAPRLQQVQLDGIPFPALPKLLLSANDLVDLRLLGIPHSGYISPEAMATGLSALTRLGRLSIEFRFPQSRPDQPSPPRSICTVLPALTYFGFRGVTEYLEDLTSLIDAPLLSYLHITFFNQLIFNTPRLCAFISHAKGLRSPSQAARITFYRDVVALAAGDTSLELRILCKASDWQLSSLTQFCDSPFFLPFNIEYLEIREDSYSRPHWQEDVEHTQWLELLLVRTFTTVKHLSLSKKFIPRVVPALQELSGDGMMNTLPVLKSIFLVNSSLASQSGPAKKSFAQFVTARQLSGRPVAVNPQG
jgi:hypothetical protein